MRQKLIARMHTAGFSMVELMVSVTIGLVLILFLSSMYLSSRSSGRVLDDNTRMQEDGRAAMALMGRSIKQAWFGQPAVMTASGVRTDLTVAGMIACDSGFATPGNTNATACAPAAGAGGSSTPALQLAFRVENTPDLVQGIGTDCNGQAAPADANGNRFVANRFYLAINPKDGFPSLMCSGNGNNIPQPVLSNVEDMVFTYGLMAQNDPNRAAVFYTTSAAEALKRSPASDGFPTVGFPPLREVVSVGVCLQLVSANLLTSIDQTLVDCKGNSVKFTDHRLRVVLRNVYSVRNNGI